MEKIMGRKKESVGGGRGGNGGLMIQSLIKTL